jgi:serine/threonine protein kinase/pSer/pThr/pTyr-binding forkhead associated (FHA) protein
MERMESPLSELVPLLLKNSKKSKVAVGPIAVQLLNCVQAIHERKHLVVDIKPENFMLAAAGKSKNLESRIRILDLALVAPWVSISSHRTNEGSTMAGTPMYASLNVHKGETASRRDDLEALGYLVAELLMQIACGKDSTDLLPWSAGKSDEEIGDIKEGQVNDPKSRFYSAMGGPSVVAVFRRYMDEVFGYSYKKTPDYESLKQILLELEVPKAAAAKPAAKPAAKAAKKTVSKSTSVPAASTRASVPATSTRAKRTTRSQSAVTNADESPAKAARAASPIEIDSDDEDDLHTAHGETVFYDAKEGSAEPMDWEMLPDENQEPVDSKPKKAFVGVKICIEDGPHKGESVMLVQGKSDTVVIGRQPRPGPGQLELALTNDSEVDDSHVKLELGVGRKNLISVNVTDLKSSSGSFIGGEKIRKGKDYRVFCGQSVRIGGSTFVIKKAEKPKTTLTQDMLRVREAESAVTEIRKPRAARSSPAVEAPSPEEAAEPALPRLKRRGVRLQVVEGPHAGESFELESGEVESFVLGSKPSSPSKGDPLALRNDRSIDASHVRLELVTSKKLTVVTVTDLKSKGGTVVNREPLGKGKSTRAFLKDRIKIGNTVVEVTTL